MKNLITGLVLLIAPAFALAVPSLCNLTAATECLVDTGGEFVQIIDTDGNTDTITSFVISRNAGYSNSFGFYDPFDTSNYLQLFNGVDGPFTATTVNWDGTSFEALGTTRTFSTGGAFGLYVSTSGGDTWYSDTSLNSDGFDHFLFFDTLGNAPSASFINVQNLVFAIEDLPNGGDKDYNDLLASCIDCAPAGRPTTTTTVPVPATMPLFGMGLMGLAWLRRRKVA